MEDTFAIVILAAASMLEIKTSLSREMKIAFASSRPDEILTYLQMASPDANLIVVTDYTIPLTDEAFFTTIKKLGVPAVVIAASVSEGFKLLEAGASDMIVRRATDTETTAYFYRLLHMHIKDTVAKYHADRCRNESLPHDAPLGKIIAIGSSTGGTETVLSILQQLPADAPPILLVQHMPPVFTKLYAERADTCCAVNVWEARDGDRPANGLVLIAPGDYHMTLEKADGQYHVACKKGERVCGQCPSVDVLFHSVARTAQSHAVGVILTGMGADGANGLLAMRKQGAYTIGQDEKTSIVYGMPRAAFELGAVSSQLPLAAIPRALLDHAVLR